MESSVIACPRKGTTRTGTTQFVSQLLAVCWYFHFDFLLVVFSLRLLSGQKDFTRRNIDVHIDILRQGMDPERDVINVCAGQFALDPRKMHSFHLASNVAVTFEEILQESSLACTYTNAVLTPTPRNDRQKIAYFAAAVVSSKNCTAAFLFVVCF